MSVEIWMDVTVVEGYEISSWGNIRRKKKLDSLGRAQTAKILSPRTNNRGESIVTIQVEGKRKTFRIHRLVLLAFVPHVMADTLQVIHKDGNKSNNHLSNLKWDTSTFEQRSREPTSVLTEDIVKLIYLEAWDRKLSKKEIADKYGCTPKTVGDIQHGRYNKE